MGFYARQPLPIDPNNGRQKAFLEACHQFSPQLQYYNNIQDHKLQMCMRNIQAQSENLISGMNYILRVNIANEQRDAAYDYYADVINGMKKTINQNFDKESVEQLRGILNDESKIQFRTFYNKDELYKGIGLLLACIVLFAGVAALVVLLCTLSANAATVTACTWILFYTDFSLANAGAGISFAIGFPKILINCLLAPLGSLLMKEIDKRQELLSPSVIEEKNEENNSSMTRRCCACFSGVAQLAQGLFYYKGHPAAASANNANASHQRAEQTPRPRSNSQL